MELEGTDVGLFVFLVLVESFLEFAVLLETALFGHGLLLFVALDDAAFGAELAELAFKHLVLAELAFERTVEQRNLDAGLQSDGIEAFLAVAEHPGFVALEFVLQLLADHLVGGKEVGCGDALAVRGIGDEDGRLGGLGEVLEILLLHGDGLGEACGLCVEAGGVDGLHVDVVAIDVVAELFFARVVVVDFIEEVFVEVGPFLEGKFLAEDAGRHVVGNEGCLDEQRSGAAHGVDEIALASPAAH